MSKHRLCTVDLAKEAGLPIHRFPTTSEEVAIAEEALARELDNLSLDERERIIFDIHGITTTTRLGEQDEATISSSLEELESELQKIPQKDAMEEALFRNAPYVKDPKFRLLFLRALEFNASAAADMMVEHFEVKRQLFGDGEVLAREIRQSDLTPRDIDLLRAGVSQVLPTRDASGRVVITINADIMPGLETLEELHRAYFYHVMAILRDEEVQTKGLVWVVYNMRNSWLDLASYHEINRVEAALPLVGLGGHYCFNSQMLRPLVAGFQLICNRYDRHRMRTHFGPLEDIHFQLQTFGIPTDVSPMQPDETWSTSYHLEWLQAQKAYEDEQIIVEQQQQQLDEEEDGTSTSRAAAAAIGKKKNEVVIIPRRFDVLFGKSSRARLSTGTQRALHLVEMHRESYERAGKFEKTKVAETIISIIHESNGRFLKQQDDKNEGSSWIEVDDLVARQKVAHWFRHMRSKTTTKSSSSSSSLQEEDENEGSESSSSAGGDSSSTKSQQEWRAALADHDMMMEEGADAMRPSKRPTLSPSDEKDTEIWRSRQQQPLLVVPS